MNINKYRHEQEVVEAVCFTYENKDQVYNWVRCNKSADRNLKSDPILKIQTHDGVQIVNIGDYIVKVNDFNYYVCEPELFETKYTIIEEENEMQEWNTNEARINQEIVALLKTKIEVEPVFEGTVLEGCERRYTIINEKDAKKYLTEKEYSQMHDMLNVFLEKIKEGRVAENKNPYNSYVVNNVDEPYINEVVAVMAQHNKWDGKSPFVLRSRTFGDTTINEIPMTIDAASGDYHYNGKVALRLSKLLSYAINNDITALDYTESDEVLHGYKKI